MYFIVPLLAIIFTGEASVDASKCATSVHTDILYGEYCYRTYDGTYNNLKNTKWGSAGANYERFLPNSYSDGRHAYPRSVTGAELMNPRSISLSGYPEVIVDDPLWTLVTVMWGQAIAHDLSLTYGVPQSLTQSHECCTEDGKVKNSANPRCIAIKLPEDDPYNAPEGRKCMNFVRTQAVPGTPYEQRNAVTGFLDLSIVYGSGKNEACSLRSFQSGQLLATAINNKQYLPPYNKPTGGCFQNNNATGNYCFAAGDERVNQNVPLTLMQTMLLRAHNQIADTLCNKINKHWDDEKCYQVTRRIMIALAQQITYYEFIPFIIGKTQMQNKNFYYENPTSYISDYNESVNPGVLNEHATAANRLYHSSIQGLLKLYSNSRKEKGTLRMSDWYDNPSVLVEDDVELKLAVGQTTQLQGKLDRFINTEVTQYFFRGNGILGADLFTIDIERGRDHGLGTYAKALEKCGLSSPKSFDDFTKYIVPGNVEILKRIYKSYEDVELIVAGLLETLLPDAISGPTFSCIMGEQFYNTRVGDRYFFENKNQPCPFTIDQLNSIRESGTISALICNNIDGFDMIQKEAFKKVFDENPLVECSSLPTLNLELWAEQSN